MKKQLISLADAVLPQSIKDKIFGLGFNLAPKRFEEFAYRYAFAPNMALSLTDIAKRGLQPKHIADVGAYGGKFAQMARSIWPDAQITMIEGNEEKRTILQPVADEVGGTLEIALLGANDGEEVEFHVMESGSSVFEENSPLGRRSETRTLRTLDAILGEGVPVDFIKIDIQGYELEALRGAAQILPKVDAVLMEISLIEINKGAPLFAEVIAFMKERDFIAHEIVELHRRPLDQAMNQIDMLFIRPSSPLISNTAHFSA